MSRCDEEALAGVARVADGETESSGERLPGPSGGVGGGDGLVHLG